MVTGSLGPVAPAARLSVGMTGAVLSTTTVQTLLVAVLPAVSVTVPR